MPHLSTLDHGKSFDWGRTSGDYAIHRPSPPDGLYQRLGILGVGLPGQRILDLGTGTGVMIRSLVKRGATGSGIDIAAEQIQTAHELSKSEGLDIEFKVSDADNTPFPDHSFDVVTALQCWWYFDVEKVLTEIKRLLKPNGQLVVAHFNYMPRVEMIAQKTEDLILKHNPKWTGANWSCEIPAIPNWAVGKMRVRGMFYFDEPIAFTRESWKGRIRACRGIAASLSPEQVADFDIEHDQLLNQITGETFTIMHRIDAHIFEF